VEFRVLGDLEVVEDGQSLAIGPHQQRAVLAVLVLSAGEVVSADRLIEALWVEHPPASAAKTVQVYVSRLRKALNSANAGELIVTVDHGYALRIEPERVDMRVFECLLEEGRSAFADGKYERAATVLRGALGLWRGPALSDFTFDAFAAVEIARLGEERLEALEIRIDADLALGRDAALVGELEALIAEHPLRERLRAQHMLALYRCGRQSEALAAYRRTREILIDEVGIEPGPELRDLQQKILRQDAGLQNAGVREPGGAEDSGALAAGIPRDRSGARLSRRSRPRILAAAVALVGGVAAVIALLAHNAASPQPARVSANTVVVVDASSDRVTNQIGVGASPSHVLSTRGAVWVTNADGHSVSLIDPAKREVRETIPAVGSGPAGLVDADGALWVANTLDGTVVRVDPATNSVVRRVPVGDSPSAVAAADGAVWVANSGEETLSRIDPVSGREVARVPLGASPTDLVSSAGSLWVSSQKDRSVLQVDPRTNKVVQSIPLPSSPAALAAGPGTVWVANAVDGTVTRIDADSGRVAAVIGVGDGPAGIVATPDAVWVSDEYGGTVDLIDPHINEVVRRIAVGNHPTGLALVGGALYVAVRASGDAHRGGTLVEATDRDLDYVDPQYADDTLSVPLLQLTNDGLTAYQHVGGAAGTQLVPDLALYLPAATDGGRTYRFVLRRGIRYSTGAIVQPQDVRASFERMFKIRSSGVGFFTGIVGAASCIKAPRRCALAKGIVVDAPHFAVTFHLTAPDPDFRDKLATWFASVLPANTPARVMRSRPLPATGPYEIASYTRERDVRLVRNPRFREWSQSAQPDGYPDSIDVRLDFKPDAAVDAVENGRADVFGGSRDVIPRSQMPQVLTRFAARAHVNPQPAVDHLFMNTRVPPFNDVRARRALNYAVDRRAVVHAFGPGSAVATCQVLPPNFPGYERYCPYHAPQLRKAQRLVDASGTRGARVVVWTNPFLEPGARAIVPVLQRLGYRARLKVVPNVDRYFLAIADSRNRIQIGSGYWFADYPAAADFLEHLLSCRAFVPRSPDNVNLAEFCDRRLDVQMRRAAATQATDPQRANRLWAAIDRRMVDAAPWVPLVIGQSVELVSKRVGNYQYNPQYGGLIDQLWLH
jgi:peptide/nickel transport system substrate-binding protein